MVAVDPLAAARNVSAPRNSEGGGCKGAVRKSLRSEGAENGDELFWDRTPERFCVASPSGDVLMNSGKDVEGCIEVLRGRLYFAVVPTRPEPVDGRIFLALNKKLAYVPFCADFG